jgi:hypothetical protein
MAFAVHGATTIAAETTFQRISGFALVYRVSPNSMRHNLYTVERLDLPLDHLHGAFRVDIVLQISSERSKPMHEPPKTRNHLFADNFDRNIRL